MGPVINAIIHRTGELEVMEFFCDKICSYDNNLSALMLPSASLSQIKAFHLAEVDALDYKPACID